MSLTKLNMEQSQEHRRLKLARAISDARMTYMLLDPRAYDECGGEWRTMCLYIADAVIAAEQEETVDEHV